MTTIRVSELADSSVCGHRAALKARGARPDYNAQMSRGTVAHSAAAGDMDKNRSAVLTVGLVLLGLVVLLFVFGG